MPGVVLVDSSAYAPSTPLFAEALREHGRRSGTEVSVVDEADYLPKVLARIRGRIGRLAGVNQARALNASLLRQVASQRPQLVIVVKGNGIAPSTLKEIRESGSFLANFMTDDPFNRLACSDELRRGLPIYHAIFSPRRDVMNEITEAGCELVRYLPFAYHPTVHFEELNPPEEWRADVSFIGGADDGRAGFVSELLKRLPEVSLRLYGGLWNRYSNVAPLHRGFVLGQPFRYAVSGASISLNLVRRSNRDGHVMRSFELPACAACVVAERTSEHEALFRDGEDIWLFDDVEECAAVIEKGLADGEQRTLMRRNARERIIAGKNSYADRLDEILRVCGSSP